MKRAPSRQFAGIEAIVGDRSFVAGWLWAMADRLGEAGLVDDDEVVLRAAARLLAADVGLTLPDPKP